VRLGKRVYLELTPVQNCFFHRDACSRPFSSTSNEADVQARLRIETKLSGRLKYRELAPMGEDELRVTAAFPSGRPQDLGITRVLGRLRNVTFGNWHVKENDGSDDNAPCPLVALCK
jgi:hypothetical protein